MFSASPFSAPTPSAGFANAYRQVGVQTGVATASPHQLVAMLYDGLLECLAQAKGAMQAGDVDLKCRLVTKAVRIVDEGLKASLDMRQGGRLAVELNELYAYVERRLTQANVRNSTELLDECKRLVEPLRDAWRAIAPQVGAVR